MKAILFFFMLFLSVGNAHSQERNYFDIDSLAEAHAKQIIKDKEVEFVLIYQNGCVGCKFIREIDCGCEDDGTDTCLIWEYEQKQYVKQIGCCVSEEVNELQVPNIYQNLINNKKEVFSSNFKYSYVNSHYRFDKLTLVSANGKKEVYLKDYYFDKDNKCWQHNLTQSAKAYIDKLSQEVGKK